MTNDLIDDKPCVVCASGEYPPWPFGSVLCENHNVCVSCGIKRSQLDHTPWGVRDGAFQCAPCEKTQREARIKARIAAGFDHEYTDEVVCPHCGYEHGDSWEMRDGEYDCPDCDMTFTVERHTTVTYTTEKEGQ